MKIGIIDYGLGNIRSVYGAIKECGYEPIVSDKAIDLSQTDKLILPGVGAFGDGIRKIKNFGLDEFIRQQTQIKKKPILGICLGFQLFYESSPEFGINEGFGWLKGKLQSFDREKIRVPHIGWNDCFQIKESILWEGIAEEALFYYVHSFYVKDQGTEEIIGKCHYQEEYVSAFQKENLYGVQFHPEKSQVAGLKLLKNFIEKS